MVVILALVTIADALRAVVATSRLMLNTNGAPR